MKPAHSIAIAIFALIVGIFCATIGTVKDDGYLRGVALGLFFLAGLNLFNAWKLRRR